MEGGEGRRKGERWRRRKGEEGRREGEGGRRGKGARKEKGRMVREKRRGWKEETSGKE